MSEGRETVCPGCGLDMPRDPAAVYEGYYHNTPECWSVYTEVLGAEFGNAVLFGAVHQLTVDTYAVQHPGGSHPDKSIGVHLAGLHLVLEKGHAPTSVPPRLQRLAASLGSWPHYPAPETRGGLTVLDVALAGSAEEHIERVRAWADQLWRAWAAYHRAVARLVSQTLGTE